MDNKNTSMLFSTKYNRSSLKRKSWDPRRDNSLKEGGTLSSLVFEWQNLENQREVGKAYQVEQSRKKGEEGERAWPPGADSSIWEKVREDR